ncbi:hypothetical protein Bdiaspc4_19660 [Bradyrhizobium diazoefficiens]|nr:hypothetical protein CO678_18835 [Bradyrhizobium diazoefficiens]QBP22578.1 hypothetical protein Bdiaspc4_19660 [Bradyrhizobium diazoefficiens]
MSRAAQVKAKSQRLEVRRSGCPHHAFGVIPREGGESNTPRPRRIPLPSLEYWIARSMTAVETDVRQPGP